MGDLESPPCQDRRYARTRDALDHHPRSSPPEQVVNGLRIHCSARGSIGLDADCKGPNLSHSQLSPAGLGTGPDRSTPHDFPAGDNSG
jgi:hypothetical protein